jgi:para-nitrobenzyl esterase
MANVGYPAAPSVVGDAIFASSGDAVVETASGKVQGYTRRGIFTFKGIPYGDDTGGANRFMPPQKAKPRSAELDAVRFCVSATSAHGMEERRGGMALQLE